MNFSVLTPSGLVHVPSLGNQYPAWVRVRGEIRGWLTWTCLPTQPSNKHFPERRRRKEFFSWIKKQIFIWLNLKFCRRVVFVGRAREETPRVVERNSLIKTQNLTTLTQSGAGKALFIKRNIRLGCAWNWGLVNRCRHATLGEIEAISGSEASVEAIRPLPDDASLLPRPETFCFRKTLFELQLTSLENALLLPERFPRAFLSLRLREKVFHENW